MRVLWCWRCQAEMPMLNEAEWAEVRGAHQAATERLDADTAVRRLPIGASGWYTRVSAAEYRDHFSAMLDAYERITGFRETNPAAVWHHQISLYGPPCTVADDRCERHRQSCAELAVPVGLVSPRALADAAPNALVR